MSNGKAIGIYYINGLIGAVAIYLVFSSLNTGIDTFGLFFAAFVGGIMPIFAWLLGYLYVFRWYQKDPSKITGFLKFCGCMYSIILFIPAYFVCVSKYENNTMD